MVLKVVVGMTCACQSCHGPLKTTAYSGPQAPRFRITVYSIPATQAAATAVVAGSSSSISRRSSSGSSRSSSSRRRSSRRCSSRVGGGGGGGAAAAVLRVVVGEEKRFRVIEHCIPATPHQPSLER